MLGWIISEGSVNKKNLRWKDLSRRVDDERLITSGLLLILLQDGIGEIDVTGHVLDLIQLLQLVE